MEDLNEDRVFDLLDGAMSRAGTPLRGVDESRYWLAFTLVDFAVALNHPGLDLDWAADQALIFSGDDHELGWAGPSGK